MLINDIEVVLMTNIGCCISSKINRGGVYTCILVFAIEIKNNNRKLETKKKCQFIKRLLY